MRSVAFEENEFYVLAIFDAGSRRVTMEEIDAAIPFVKDDEEIFPLVINTIEKLKRISDLEYRRLDLEPYKQEAEEEE